MITRRRAISLAAAGLTTALGLMPRGAAGKPLTLPGSQKMQSCCPIVELRQYTLHPGTRQTFTNLFESTFLDPLEEDGNRVIGQFKDLDDPDRFVWIRGWDDMPARAQGLTKFYDGDLWHRHRNEANACILDSDNVLLMREAQPGSGFPAEQLARRASAKGDEKRGLLLGFIQYSDPEQLEPFTNFFANKMISQLMQLGLPPLAVFCSGAGENNFPRLPVRDREYVHAWFTACSDPFDAHRAVRKFMDHQHLWREGASDPILHQLERKPEILRLEPMPRSAMRALPEARS